MSNGIQAAQSRFQFDRTYGSIWGLDMLAITISCLWLAGIRRAPRQVILSRAGGAWHPTDALLVLFVLLLPPNLLFAQSPGSEKQAWQIYHAAQKRMDQALTNAAAAWEFGRAAYDVGDLAVDARVRSEVAQAGIDACRHALTLDPNSAAAHYYLALNLGQLARAKRLGALKLVREMERELHKAAELNPAFDYAGPARSLGMLYLEAPSWLGGIGNRNKARAQLETAVRLEPYYPENHLCLAEAYARWSEVKSLERQLEKLDELWPKAEERFGSGPWVPTWHQWNSRLQKLRKSHEHLLANPRISPSQRGARQSNSRQ
jgi:tetratricopeptide (TPR) repeat protein